MNHLPNTTSPVLARLEADKIARESRNPEQLRQELNTKMNDAAERHNAILQEKQQTSAALIENAKKVASQHIRTEGDDNNCL